MGGKDFSKFKKDLSDALIATICPIGKKITELKKDQAFISKILNEGSKKANSIAQENIKEVKKIVGFI